MSLIRLLLLTVSLLGAGQLWAAPILGPTSSWSAAQAGRTWMDVGGVWNGTAEVTATTGDTVTFVLNNTAVTTVANHAYDIVLSALLPVGFNYVAGTATVGTTGAGCTAPVPTITAVQTDTALALNLSAGYDLYAQCQMTISYGITTAATMSSGTYQITHQWDYAATQGGALTGAPGGDPFNVLVQTGASVISKLPVNQVRAVGATAVWTAVDVQNTGLGGLFDVSVDEYTINPSAALTLTAMTATAPAAPSATTFTSPTAAKRLLQYLAPNGIFKHTVSATITSCKNINNTVYTTDRTGATAKSGTAQVTLDKLLPTIGVSVNNYTLAYNAVTPMSVTISNTGTGAANVFTLQSTLNTQGIAVTAVSAGWTYNATNGLFTYTATAGTIAAAATITLNFSVAATNACTFSGAVNVGWTAKYSDPCGDLYNVPTVSNTLTLPTASLPSLTLNNQSVASGTTTPVVDRFAVGTTARFVVDFYAANTSLINGTSFVVTNVLPAGITGITTTAAGATATCPAATCLAGDTITWTIPKAGGTTTTAQLLIDFTTPANTCSGGTSITNTANTTATSVQTCALSASASTSPLLTNNLGAAVTQSFNVGTPLAGVFFETGSPTASTVPTRAATGDGEFIPFTAAYTFGAGAGTWTGSTYKDDFAGSGATLVPNTLTYSINAAASVVVPPANVTCTAGTVVGNNCSGSITIDLGFLSAVNGGNVAKQSLSFTYQTTIPNAALGALSSTKLTQLATLTVAAGAAGGCAVTTNQSYTLGAFVPIAKAQAHIALTMPATLDVCEPATATMTVSNVTEQFASNVMATFPTTGSYDYPIQQTPTYGGLFTAANITYAAAAVGGPTFTLAPSLSANGSITFVLQLKRGSTTTPVAAQVRVDYDDYQTSNTVTRDFYATGQFTPTLVRKGLLAISMTPQRYTVVNSTASWQVFVTNLGDGTAFGATLDNLLPTGMGLDSVATNAANGGQCAPLGSCNATVVGQTASWALGDIPPGSTRTITLHATIAGGTCMIADGSNHVTAKWGCGGVTLGPAMVREPNFLFPAGQMQVVHDTTNTFAPLCGVGKDVIIVRNTGVPDIFDVYAQEVLNTATTGLTLVAGTVQYSVDGGTNWLAAPDPTGTGVSADPYTWTKVQIPALADLYSATGGGVSEVRIRFDINVGENANNAPTITASGTGTISCGNPVSSLGTPYVIPVQKPNVVVTKAGINRTVTPTGGVYGTPTFGGQGDTVEWKVTVQNTGTVDAYNVRFADIFAGSGATTMSVYQQPAADLAATIADRTVYSLSNLPKAGAVQTYLLRETLGATCANWGSNNTVNVSWGCINNGAAVASNITAPSANKFAGLVMQPGFGDFSTVTQTTVHALPPAGAANWSHQFPGVVQVNVPFNNGGAAAKNIRLSSNTLPANMMVDPYATMSVTGTAVNTAAGACLTNLCLDGTASNMGTATAPIFKIGGSGMRNNTNATLSYYLVPKLTDDQYATVYPDLALSEPNAANNILDPMPSAYGGTYMLSLDTYSTCNTFPSVSNSAIIDPLIPDLDMTVSPAYALVTDGYTMDVDFNFQNVGDVNSIVQFIDFYLPVVGSGLTINSVIVAKSGLFPWGSCSQIIAGNPNSWTCPPSTFGYSTANGAASLMTVRVNVTVHDNGSPFTLIGEVTGKSKSQDGNTLLGNFSHDRAAPRILGVNFKKTLVSTSETFTADPYVAIGEELTYDLYARLFGGDPSLAPAAGNLFQSMTFRDTLPTGVGLVSIAAQPNSTLAPTISGTATPAASNPLQSGTIDIYATAVNTGSAVLDYYVTARVFNGAGNVDGTVLTNHFGGSLTYQGQLFHSDNIADGFSGGTAVAGLHASYVMGVQLPVVTISKLVRNFTAAGAFGATATGTASDTYEYQVVLTNTSTTTPAFDLSVIDNLPTTLLLIDGATDGVDNDGDGTTDTGDLEGKFTVVAAPTGGGSILFDDAYTAIATVDASLARLNAGQSVTLRYRTTGNPSKVGAGVTVVNTATATYTTLPGIQGTAMSTVALRASGAFDGEGSTDVYSSATINMTARISGTVYLDANKDSIMNGAEAGTGLTLYVKLIDNNAPGLAVAAQVVDPTSGSFSFPTAAAGTYHTIVDTNNTLADVTATIPTAWIGTQIPNQIRPAFTLAVAGSKVNEDFGMYQSLATLFSGRVFEDNGITGGTAHNGIQEGAEKGLPKVLVELTDCSTNVYATAYTNGSGDFTLALLDSLGIADATTLCIQETNPTAYLSTGGAVGTTAGTYSVATDKHTFVLNKAGSPFTGVTFGDIAPNTFLTDNEGTALPGTTKFYPHLFTASTAGTVAFSSTFIASPNTPGWSNVIYRDVNCNQQMDAGDTQITTAITVTADSYTCILDKQFVPLNIPYDSRNLVTLQADFTYFGGNAALPVKTYTRTDTTIVGQEGLVLHKAVDKPTSRPGDVITYTITYTNPTQGVLNNLMIYDTTPAYTTFTSATCGVLGTGLTACAPTGPTVGATGAIQWAMTGTLQPNGSGTVTYQVTVD